MKLRLTTLVAALAALVIGSELSAQNTGTVSGRVIDQQTQQPLPGVQDYVAGLNRGTLTNQRGQFVIPNIAAGQ